MSTRKEPRPLVVVGGAAQLNVMPFTRRDQMPLSIILARVSSNVVKRSAELKSTGVSSIKRPTRRYPTIAVCGLDCGLCPRFYTVGSSRCPGCAGLGFFDRHPSCSFITCCVRKRRLGVCSECSEFPCAKFKSAEEYRHIKESSSYPSAKRIIPNLFYIKEHGIRDFVEQQKKRISLLKTMIARFDDGRSRSYFCRAATLHDIVALKDSVKEATRVVKNEKINQNDMKSKAKILKAIINGIPLAD